MKESQGSGSVNSSPSSPTQCRFQAEFKEDPCRDASLFSRAALLGTLLAIGLGFQPMAPHAASVNASTTTVDYSLTASSTIGVPARTSGPSGRGADHADRQRRPPHALERHPGKPAHGSARLNRVQCQSTGRGAQGCDIFNRAA